MDSLNAGDTRILMALVRAEINEIRTKGINYAELNHVFSKLEYIVALMDGRQITHLAPAGNAGETGAE